MFEQNVHRLKHTLLKAGVSPRYVKRTLRELQDHHSDIKTRLLKDGLSDQEAGLLAEQQLGDLQDIAANTVSRKELLSFISLHPKLFFLVSPLLWYVLAAAFCALMVRLNVEFIQSQHLGAGDPMPPINLLVFTGLAGFYLYILPLLLSLAFILVARNRLLDKSLIYISLVLISLLGSLLMVEIQGGDLIGQGSLHVSLGGFDYRNFTRFAVTLALAHVMLLCAIPRSRTGQQSIS